MHKNAEQHYNISTIRQNKNLYIYLHGNILLIILICYFSSKYNLHGRAIGLMSRVFTNSLGDWGSIPGRVIPKTQKNDT